MVAFPKCNALFFPAKRFTFYVELKLSIQLICASKLPFVLYVCLYQRSTTELPLLAQTVAVLLGEQVRSDILWLIPERRVLFER